MSQLSQEEAGLLTQENRFLKQTILNLRTELERASDEQLSVLQSNTLEFSKENHSNEKIIRLGQFGEIYILPHSMVGKLIKHFLLIDQAVDHKINNSDLCFHYYDYVDETDGYKKIVDEYNPTSQENAEKGKPFMNLSMKNCLMFSKGDWGNIATSKELCIFEEVFEFWNDPQFKYAEIMEEILNFNEK